MVACKEISQIPPTPATTTPTTTSTINSFNSFNSFNSTINSSIHSLNPLTSSSSSSSSSSSLASSAISSSSSSSSSAATLPSSSSLPTFSSLCAGSFSLPIEPLFSPISLTTPGLLDSTASSATSYFNLIFFPEEPPLPFSTVPPSSRLRSRSPSCDDLPSKTVKLCPTASQSGELLVPSTPTPTSPSSASLSPAAPSSPLDPGRDHEEEEEEQHGWAKQGKQEPQELPPFDSWASDFVELHSLPGDHHEEYLADKAVLTSYLLNQRLRQQEEISCLVGKRKRAQEDEVDLEEFKSDLAALSKKFGFPHEFGLEPEGVDPPASPISSFIAESPPANDEVFDDDADWDENEEEDEDEEDDDKDSGSEPSWTTPRRPRPGLSLTSVEIEMVLNCYSHFIKTSNVKDCCILVGKVLKVGRRKVFEVIKERERLITKHGAPADCVPLPRNQKKRGKPRDKVLTDGYLKALTSLLSSSYKSKGAFPKVSDVQTFLKNLPPAGERIPGLPSDHLSPGPLVCNQKTLKSHLTRLRKNITATHSRKTS